MASVADLPAEILTAIFLLLIPDDGWMVPDPKLAPLLLCSVCSTWRNVALGAGNLWDSLHLAPHDPAAALRCIAMSKTWLSRAHGRPISLSLSNTRSLHPHTIDEIYDRFTLRRLRLGDPSMSNITALFSTPAPSLQILDIREPHPYISWRHASSSTGVIFPALTRLSVSARYNLPSVHPLPINWGCLTRLRLERAGTLQTICTLLEQCTALTMCYIAMPLRLTAPPFPGFASTPRRAATLPQLTTLTLNATFDIPALLEYFSFPALTTLSLGPSAGDTLTEETLRALDTVSAPALQCLSLNMYCRSQALVRQLERFPNITELRLNLKAAVLQALVARPDVVPALSQLTLVYGAIESENRESVEVLAEVAARRVPASGIQLVVDTVGVATWLVAKCTQTAMRYGFRMRVMEPAEGAFDVDLE
ncbi:hypothetical protein C8F01DRAFT_1318350 [Mycena amicta]|nr:hypothetical protein C8F01DRAFT_1318350 [Mycena amicta]